MGNVHAFNDILDDNDADSANKSVSINPELALLDESGQPNAAQNNRLNSRLNVTTKSRFIFHRKPSGSLLGSKRPSEPKQLSNLLQSIPEIDYPATIGLGDSNFIRFSEEDDDDIEEDIEEEEPILRDGEYEHQTLWGGGTSQIQRQTCQIRSPMKEVAFFHSPEDTNFPDSITIRKLRHWFYDELKHGLPYIDDGEFYDGNWYLGNNSVMSHIPNLCSLDNSQIKKIQYTTISESTPMNTSNIAQIVDKIEIQSKKVTKRKLCGCLHFSAKS